MHSMARQTTNKKTTSFDIRKLWFIEISFYFIALLLAFAWRLSCRQRKYNHSLIDFIKLFQIFLFFYFFLFYLFSFRVLFKLTFFDSFVIFFACFSRSFDWREMLFFAWRNFARFEYIQFCIFSVRLCDKWQYRWIESNTFSTLFHCNSMRTKWMRCYSIGWQSFRHRCFYHSFFVLVFVLCYAAMINH